MTEGTEHEEPVVEGAADGGLDDDAGQGAEAQVVDVPADVATPDEPAGDDAPAAEEQPTVDPDPVAEAEQVVDDAPADVAAPDEQAAEAVIAEDAPIADDVTAEGEEPSGSEETDDVAAAIAEAGENIEAEPSLDDIAPGTVVAQEAVAVEPDAKPNSVSIWPFVAYVVVWAAFAGVLVWQMEALPKGVAVWQAADYTYYVLGGVVLTVAGPLMILAVWIASWGKPGSTKGGLFVSALMKGSIATLIGVLMWWAALLSLDQIRFGSLL